MEVNKGLVVISIVTAALGITVFIVGNKFFMNKTQGTTTAKVLKYLPFAIIVTGLLGALFTKTEIEKPSSNFGTIVNYGNDSVVLKRDSLILLPSNEQVKKERIDKIIRDFMYSLSLPNDVPTYFYADTVKAFYLRKNVTVAEIEKESWKWKKQHPRAKTQIKEVTVGLKKEFSDVYALTNFYVDSLEKPIDVTYHLRFDKNNKIFYVQNLAPKTFDPTFDSTFNRKLP